MPVPLNLVFLGSDPIALPLLDWLAEAGGALARVTAVYTQPDRPAGRGQRTGAGPIKRWAEARGLPVCQPEKMARDQGAWLAAPRADVALVMAYGHILSEDFIAVPRLGALNLHASLLPKYRGASPIQTAVACGERVTGVTLMRIVKQLDAGPVADWERVAIDPLDTAPEVEAKLARACVPLLARTLPVLGRGDLAFRDQDHAAATYCRRLVKTDSRLDFAAPAGALAARINGLHPWPGCAVEINGVTVKLGLADVGAGFGAPGGNPAPPGTVVGTDREGLLVSTGEGTLRLRRLQRPGGRLLPAPEFLRGFPLVPGARLPSQPMAPLVSPAPFR